MASMMRSLAVFFLMLLLWPSSICARPTTPAEARQVVEAWLSMDRKPLGAGLGSQVTEVKTYQTGRGETSFFVVCLDAGFVIVSPDDLVEPIIAFAPRGSFQPSLQNPLYALISTDLPGRLAEVKAEESQAGAQGLKFIPKGLPRRAQGKWQSFLKVYSGPLLAAPTLEEVSDERVSPLVESKWGQSNVAGDYCYNYYTPFNEVCGCVATGMAQLMRYHAFPVDGVGTPSFRIKVHGKTQVRPLRGGDGWGGPYYWNSMPLVPDGNISDAERQAIGALTHDAGVTVHMDYTGEGSGARSANIAPALTQTFGYSNAKFGYFSHINLPTAPRNRMINPNLDAQLPVLLGIGGAGGHLIVADGYGYTGSTLYHHLNLGWSGQDDAWYSLPIVKTKNYNFNSVTSCTYNVFTQGAGEIISGRVLDASGNPVNEAVVTATREGGGTYQDSTNNRGIYSLYCVPSRSTYTLEATKEGFVFNSREVKTGASRTNSTTVGNLWGINFVAEAAGAAGGPAPLFFQKGAGGLSLAKTLDNDTLAFITGGAAPWFGQSAWFAFGESSAQSGPVADGQFSWLETTLVGPGTLSFDWRVSCSEDTGLLEFFLDEEAQGSLAGETGWRRQTLSIPPGSHTLKWTYSRSGALSQGLDCGWVDRVVFRPR